MEVAYTVLGSLLEFSNQPIERGKRGGFVEESVYLGGKVIIAITITSSKLYIYTHKGT